MIENRWVTSESTFVPMEWWDACLEQNMRPLLSDHSLAAWIGLDAVRGDLPTATTTALFW